MTNMIAILLSGLMLSACVSPGNDQGSFETSSISVEPGTEVMMRGQPVKLYQGSLRVGDNLLEKLRGFKHDMQGSVSVISFVPSIDTPVCETQTHILGETQGINPKIKRITLSRDLPMAQSRFAKEAKLTNISYISDYKDGRFGKATGLMMRGSELLARGVIVTDEKGIVRYYQLVPDVTQLPDMQKAIEFANNLAEPGARAN